VALILIAALVVLIASAFIVSVPERGFVALILAYRFDIDGVEGTEQNVSVPERGFVALIRIIRPASASRQTAAFQSPSGDSWL
jgi:hypothetical protein